jgi:lysophospholipase L1-like esterase
LISFKIAGPGLIAAVDNGDNSSHEPFQGSERHAFQGRSVAIVRARASSGRITVSASAVGLAGASVIISTVANTSQSSSRSARIPTLFVIGDSTVRNGRGDGANGQWGWGDEIAPFFDLTKINIVNSALGGRSSRTYMTEGHWARVLSQLKPGDFVIMQFGHNDGGEINDTSRARGSLRGTGPETQEIDNLLTKQHEVVHSFGWYLRKYIADIKSKKATAIVCSLIPRKIWKDGKMVRSADTYAGWAAEVARSENVAFVDLNEIISRRYDDLGPEKVEPLFADPHTHTSLAGAKLNAACVVEGLKSLKRNPLAPYLRSQPLERAKPSPSPAQ